MDEKSSGKDVAHPKREEKLLLQWQQLGVFEKSVNSRPENKPYVFYDGPPFATGLPHYGHILSSVIKDVVPRYWTMRGYRVRRRWGWDCHGLPIESLVEKELGISGKRDIEAKLGVAQFNDACRSKVLLYTQEWKKMVDRIGRWIEFDNAYKTMDPTYMESVWWALKKIWDKELIYEGRKVLLYCPRCETPVSKAEVAMDNSYKDVTGEAVTVKLRIKNQELRIKDVPGDASVYILAWTTTPWALPGNVALAVGEEIVYAIVKADGVYYVVAEALVENVFAGKPHEIVKKLPGVHLLGLQYEPLFDVPAIRDFVGTGRPDVTSGSLPGRAAPYSVVPGNFVTTDEGTGVVHTAVMYGEDDYNLGVELGLPTVPMLDAAGRYNDVVPEFLRGKYIKDAEREIKKYLEEKGLLFNRQQNTHSYPHCWRCETPLIYNAISAWFINIQAVKPRLLELNQAVNWYPEHLKEGRFKNILETAPDWNISRNRYWATPLPFWKCWGRVKNHPPASQARALRAGELRIKECDNVVCIGSVKELKEKATNFDEVYSTDNVFELDLHKHVVDKIKLRCPECGGEMTRIAEVIDCWVESAAMPFAEFHYPFENQNVFKQRLRGEGHFIAEYISQTRAWFYYMHAMAVLLEEDYEKKSAFRNAVTTGVVLNEKGEKMSKSKRNFPDPWDIIEKYGVDALRYYLMSSPVMKADDLFFSEKGVDEVYKKVILITRNVLAFWQLYAGENYELRIKNQGGLPSAQVMDKWIVARTEQLVREMTTQMDAYQVAEATRLIAPFADDLSTWYVRRSRDRFKSSPENAQDAVATLGWVLQTFAKIIAPIMPFLAEHVYLAVGGEKESVHLEEWPEGGVKNQELRIKNQGVLEEMAIVRQVVEVVHSIRKEKRIRLRQPLEELQLTFDTVIEKNYAEIITDEVNVKKVSIAVLREKNQGFKISGESEDWVKQVKESGICFALKVKITNELRAEGIAADMMRYIAAARKQAGLQMGDKATALVAVDDATIKAAIQKHRAQIMADTGLVALDPGIVDAEPVKVEGKAVKIKIEKI